MPQLQTHWFQEIIKEEQIVQEWFWQVHFRTLSVPLPHKTDVSRAPRGAGRELEPHCSLKKPILDLAPPSPTQFIVTGRTHLPGRLCCATSVTQHPTYLPGRKLQVQVGTLGLLTPPRLQPKATSLTRFEDQFDTKPICKSKTSYHCLLAALSIATQTLKKVFQLFQPPKIICSTTIADFKKKTLISS